MFRVKIIPDGGDPFEVVAGTRDIAKWEKTTKGATFAAFQADQRITDLYIITFHALVRQSLWDGTLADLLDTCDLDLIDEDGEEADPTPSAA